MPRMLTSVAAPEAVQNSGFARIQRFTAHLLIKVLPSKGRTWGRRGCTPVVKVYPLDQVN